MPPPHPWKHSEALRRWTTGQQPAPGFGVLLNPYLGNGRPACASQESLTCPSTLSFGRPRTFLGVQLGRLDPLSQANAAAHLVLSESEATVDPNTGGFWTKLSQGLLTFFFSRHNFNSPVGMGFFLLFVKLFQKHRLSGRHIVSILKHSFKSLKETSLKRAPLTPYYQIIHIKIQNSLVVAILRNGNSMGRIILCVH